MSVETPEAKLIRTLTFEVDSLPEGGLRVSCEKSVRSLYAAEESDLYKEDGLGEVVSRPVELAFSVRAFERDVRFEGSVVTWIKKACDRCLESIERRFDGEWDLICVPRSHMRTPRNPEEEHELKREELDVVAYGGGQIDLRPLLLEQLELLIPMKFLCMENCKGLCGSCGQNLNVSRCSCETSDTSSSPLGHLISNVERKS